MKDVEVGSYRVYPVAELPSGLPRVFPPELVAKLTQVDVAVSGCVDTGLAWMLICPHRLDTVRGSDGSASGVSDIDPAIVLFDSASQEPSPSGLVGYHLDFPGRTQPITGTYDWHDTEATVSGIRSQVVSSIAPLESAPASVLNSLHYMAERIRSDPSWPQPPGRSTNDPTPNEP